MNNEQYRGNRYKIAYADGSNFDTAGIVFDSIEDGESYIENYMPESLQSTLKVIEIILN